MKENIYKKVGILIVLTVFFLGCAPATVQTLKENPSGQLTFEINENYQPVYRTILTNARRCYQTGPRLVQGDLYTDIKKGNVSIALHGIFDRVFAAVDVEAVAEDKTKVIIYYGLDSWAYAIEAWVRQGADKCN